MTRPRYDLTSALTLAVRFLGGRYSRRWLHGLLMRHENPNTLAALVDACPKCGIEAKAYRMSLDDLEAIESPAIFHFADGFATLLAQTEEGLIFAAGRRQAPISVAASALTSSWSGIVVVLQKGEEAGEPENHQTWARMREWLQEQIWERLSQWVDPGLGLGFRVAGLVLAVILLLVQLVNLATHDLTLGVAFGLELGLLAVATFFSFVLFALSRSTRSEDRPRLAQRLCGQPRQQYLDCDSVLRSRFAGVGRWSLASLGAAFFSSTWLTLAILPLWASWDSGVSWLGAVFFASSPLALLLVVVQIWPLRKICPLCMGVHAAVLLGGTLAFWLGPAAGGDFAQLLLLATLQAFLLLLLLGFALPWIEANERSRFLERTIGLATSTPFSSLALALSQQPCPPNLLPDSPIRFGKLDAPIRFDLFLSPLCATCGPVLEGLFSLQGDFVDLLRLELHPIPRTNSVHPGEEKLCLWTLALADRAGTGAAIEALRLIKEAPRTFAEKAALSAQPIPELSPILEEIEGFAEALDHAKEVLERAKVGAAFLEKGLPILLLAGFPFDGSLAHLRHLLGSKKALLLESLRSQA